MVFDIPIPTYTPDQIRRFINIFQVVSIIIIILIILNLILNILKSIHVIVRNIRFWRRSNFYHLSEDTQIEDA